jgi:dUTPase
MDILKDETPKFYFAIAADLADKCKGTDFKPSDFLPKKANSTDSGWDVRSTDNLVIKPTDYFKIGLGFRVFIPAGWELRLPPRSSTMWKKFSHCNIGVIDEEFEQQCCAIGSYLPSMNQLNVPPLKIEFGERIMQLLPQRRQEMIVEETSNEELDKMFASRNSTRKGGFGSSGNK